MITTPSHPQEPLWTSENVEQKTRATIARFLWKEVDDERLKDQVLKIDTWYRLGKILLMEQYWDNYKKQFLEDVFDETNKYIDSLESEAIELDRDWDRIAYLVDKILIFFLQQVHTLHDISIDEVILQENFWYSIAHAINSWQSIHCDNVEYKNKHWELWGKIVDSYTKEVKIFVQSLLERDFTEYPSIAQSATSESYNALLFEKFKYAISLAHLKFHGRLRNTWEEYYEHPLRIGSMHLEQEGAVSLTSLILDFLHDLKEDTNINKTIKLLFSAEIDLSVEVLSKKSILKFALNDTHYKGNVNEIFNSGLVNSNLLTTDKINSILRKAKGKRINRKATSFSEDETQRLISLGMTQDQVFALTDFNEIRQKYGEIRIEEYNNRFQDKETLMNYIKNLAEDQRISFQQSECEKIAQYSVETKARDRLDNLRNPKIWEDWEIDVDKHYEKVKETETYFLKIFREMIPGSNTLRDIETIVKNVNEEALASV